VQITKLDKDANKHRIVEKYPDDKEFQRITKEEIQKKSRDNARTPMQVRGTTTTRSNASLTCMQWENAKYAGFSTAKPWQKENESYTEINAAAQVGVKDSVFEYWASILRLRKSHKDIFIYGSFEMVDAEHNDVFAYTRTFDDQKVLVVANFRKEKVTWELPKNLQLHIGGVLISNYGQPNLKDKVVELRPFEAFACLTS
jgi:glycosidase